MCSIYVYACIHRYMHVYTHVCKKSHVKCDVEEHWLSSRPPRSFVQSFFSYLPPFSHFVLSLTLCLFPSLSLSLSLSLSPDFICGDLVTSSSSFVLLVSLGKLSWLEKRLTTGDPGESSPKLGSDPNLENYC